MHRYAADQCQRIATDMEADAQRHDQTAQWLEAKGKTVAAGIQRRGAEERREIAAAARTSSDALSDLIDN
jgi:phage terminase Nu1 subunit (DNA packaging protein)